MRDNEQACINAATFNDDVAQNLATSSLDEASSFAYSPNCFSYSHERSQDYERFSHLALLSDDS